jgi:uncharacterized protein (TIRG00374 family)
MSLKRIISIATLVLVAILIFFSRHELVEAAKHIPNMNIWILLLFIPMQALMFFAAGEIYFSYLRAKGKLKGESIFGLTRLSLEINFVNHVVPSGGVSGLGYMMWRLKNYGVSAGQATIMHLVRYLLVALVTTVVMIVSTIFLALSGVALGAIIFSAAIALAMFAAVVIAVVVLSKEERVHKLCKFVVKFVNQFVKAVTFGKIPKVVKQHTVDAYFTDLRHDYVEVMKDKKILVRPATWAIVYSLMDSGTFWIAFLALGAGVSFFPVAIAQGMASIVGMIAITPGGVGIFEGAMVMYFVATGINPGTAIIATLVTRMVVMTTTIATGWGFYQHSLLSGGKKAPTLKELRSGPKTQR